MIPPGLPASSVSWVNTPVDNTADNTRPPPRHAAFTLLRIVRFRQLRQSVVSMPLDLCRRATLLPPGYRWLLFSNRAAGREGFAVPPFAKASSFRPA